jgi:maleate isomerase
MEPDFHHHVAPYGGVSTTRIFLEEVTREAEVKMLRDELPQALRLIKTIAPRLVVFGCTSAGSLDGVEHDAAIARSIEEATGARAVTVVASVLAQLRRIEATRVAIFTPYGEELTRSVANCVVEGGHKMVKAAGMGILDNREIGRVSPDEIVKFVEGRMVGVSADCLFLSCTNWRAVAATGRLRKLLGLPVLSSNQACIDEVLLAMNHPASVICDTPRSPWR